jgi:phosphotransferase system HPr (HPr) family protein
VQQGADAMTAEPLRARVTIPNEQGLHMRPLGEFVKLVLRFQSSVYVQKHNQPRVNGRSIMDLLTLGADQGTELTLEVSGPDQEAALPALVGFLQNLIQWEEANSAEAP